MQAIFRASQHGNLLFFQENIHVRLFKEMVFASTHAKSGDTVLHYAVRHGHLGLTKFLVSEGFQLEIGNFDGKRPLHEAAQFGQNACLEYILSFKCNIDSLKRADWTALMLACTKDNLPVIKTLVEHEASLKLRNKDGWNCFHIAVREGHLPIIQYLLQLDGSLWDTVSKNGRTPLHTAALHGDCDVVEYLLSACQYVADVKDSCGSTPFMDAIRVQDLDVARLLINKQMADIAMEDNLGRRAVHVASQTGCVKSIQYLVDECNVNPSMTCTGNGASTLHIAAKEGHKDVLLLLIDLGVDINITDTKGRTALHIAAGAQHAGCVHVLLQHGADYRLDHSGTSPKQLTLKQEVLQAFQEHENTRVIQTVSRLSKNRMV